MRIISRYQDYYDFVGKRYGEDPDAVYVRRDTGSPVVQSRVGLHLLFCNYGPVDRETRKPLPTYECTYLVAGTRVFPYLTYDPAQDCNRGPKRVVSLEEFKLCFYDRLESYAKSDYEYVLRPNCGVPPKTLIELIQAVGAPVFEVPRVTYNFSGHEDDRRVFTVHVASQVPVLRDYGIPALVSPEQMWQNIYSCLQNVLRKNPDKAPPVELGNNDKIVKAGFDLKTSFRGKSPK